MRIAHLPAPGIFLYLIADCGRSGGETGLANAELTAANAWRVAAAALTALAASRDVAAINSLFKAQDAQAPGSG